MRRIVVHCDTYDFDLLVQRGGTLVSCHDAYHRRIKRPVESLPTKEPIGRYYSAHDTGGYIWLSSKAGAGALAHEVFHAVYHQLSMRGVILRDESEEAYAYLLQELMSKIVRGVGL